MTLRVVDLTRKATLVERGRVADTFWSRLKGLIGVRELPDGDGLLIMPCNSVHCMFMSIPIDVIYVDADHRIVDIDHAMKPWRVGRPRRQARYVIETPAGMAERVGAQPGDQLRIEIKS
ncbi:MAG: DUF192 domain-containing protein [Chloroflexi bacterium]|nr:DUF192 domain-containing protein [Chloroflexota bacterium]